MKSLLFVCTGNTCRSPMAEALCKKRILDPSQLQVVSAGVQAIPGLPASSMTLRLLKEEGIDFSNFQSQLVTPALMKDSTYVITMTQQHRAFLIRHYPQYQEKIFLLTEWTTQEDLPDPIGGGFYEYQACAEVIKASLESILSFIKECL